MGAPKVHSHSKYKTSQVTDSFEKEIKKQFSVEGEVAITSRLLTDLDNDGAYDDLAGTALLKVGRSFKSFIFLLREDGSMRFLEANGSAFSAKTGLNTLYCSDKAIVCSQNETLSKAASRLGTPQFYVTEFDKDLSGLEIVIPLVSGEYSYLNSLEVFAGN